MPIVSIIIPFYNHLYWLKEAVESVLHQIYDDYEIILINDGSTEDISLIAPYLDKQNITYFYQVNMGPSAARNIGIRNAKGKYLAFLDADDLFLPDKLGIQVQILNEKQEVVLCHTSYQRMNEQCQPIEIIHSGRFSGSVYPMIYDGCPIATSSVMLKKIAIQNTNCFIENVRIGEDVLLWAEIAKQGSIYGIDLPLTSVRMHSHNAALLNETQITGENNIIKYGILKAQNIPWKQRRMFLSNKYHNIAYNYYRINKQKKAFKNLAYSFWYNPFTESSKILSSLLRKIKNYRAFFPWY
jgi:glycosyltransferase involved in cell wall biosynthesis